MTWDARDSMPQRKQGEGLAPPARHAPTEEAANGHLAPPVPLPTYAQAAAYLTPDEEGEPIRWTLQEERALMADGIWPEREWSAWRHAMTRGVVAE